MGKILTYALSMAVALVIGFVVGREFDGGGPDFTECPAGTVAVPNEIADPQGRITYDDFKTSGYACIVLASGCGAGTVLKTRDVMGSSGLVEVELCESVRPTTRCDTGTVERDGRGGTVDRDGDGQYILEKECALDFGGTDSRN